ncbi:FAD-dependent oxidoreductase [Halalkaliarchaeum sp. AArc-GB]|uniref:GcvT family protein n=1 Tax=unclassified Halalkaliarchaeum TaxID=2678344 RepID=UPI00217DF7CE|nr:MULTISPECIES: FAD-dependent oxidoreductase [unclassified Halalkaliarchaeum]MDR5671980.1 FAD-dependent oxidoreductase [Halalkaliarchaeum sp. AArc-GB]
MTDEDFPESAETVIIGAGIVGNSLVYHLAERGKTDMLQIDKGPLPDPGGSTGHASNFIMPIEHNSEMTELTHDSIEQFDEVGVFENSGGIEVARTERRMEDLRRRAQSAQAFGTNAEMLEAQEVKQRVPYINEDVIEGGMYTPDAGTCDPLRFGEVYRERAKDMDALTVSANTEVLDIHVDDGEVTAVETDRGTVEVTGEVVVAAGVWSPKLAEMAGTRIPLYPVAHQMISVGPIDKLAEDDGEINYPVVRDMDTRMYERPHGNDMEVGSYEHRPLLYDVDEIPSIDEAPLSPTQLPFTEDAFEDSFEHALEIMPDVLDDPDAGVRHAIDGLISLTPDEGPVVGPVNDVDGLWSCAAIWIRLAPGITKEMARWMTEGWGAMETDLHSINVARFDGYGRGKEFVKERAYEGFTRHYGINHPKEQWDRGRDVRRAPFHDRQEELDAQFHETAGWERPAWYESNEDLLDRYRDDIEGLRRPNDWDSEWWSPIILAEHLHLRNAAGIVGNIGFGIIDVEGEDARSFLERMAVAPMDFEPGKTTYTPLLDSDAAARSDVTIARLGRDHFRLITGGTRVGPDYQWLSRHLRDDEAVSLSDRSSSMATMGVWGPNARGILQDAAEEDMSDEAFPAYGAQKVTIGPVEGWAIRVSYVGELGWEIYVPMEQGARTWDELMEAGQKHDLRPVGTEVYANTGRIEKNYRAYGHELRREYDVIEADLAFHGVKDADFIGKEAYAEALESDQAATLCTLSVDDHAPNGGEKRFMLGGEPILDENGDVLVDEQGRRSYVTSAETGPSVGKHLLLSYLPAEYATEGEQLQVLYFGEQYPVTVEAVGSEPLFDPENERLHG